MPRRGLIRGSTVIGLLLSLMPAPGCSPRVAVKAQNALVAARPYRSRVPSKLDPRKEYPLLIVLHGLGGDGEHIERYYDLDQLVDEQGFLAAYPDGTREAGNGALGAHRRFWNATDLCCDFFHSGVDDVAYLDAVIDDMSANYRVDKKRIFLAGLSNGGYMAHRYACDRASRVAAIVSQAGAMWTDVSRCNPSEPVAVLQIHGTADAMVPYEGRGVPGKGPVLVSAHQSVSDWVAFDKCNPQADTGAAPMNLFDDETPPAPFPGGAETTVEKWSGCRGVELWTARNVAHVGWVHQPAWPRTLLGWLMAHPKP